MNAQIAGVQRQIPKLPIIANMLFVKNAIKLDLQSNGFKIKYQ